MKGIGKTWNSSDLQAVGHLSGMMGTDLALAKAQQDTLDG